jgi:hypothetical protein
MEDYTNKFIRRKNYGYLHVVKQTISNGAWLLEGESYNYSFSQFLNACTMEICHEDIWRLTEDELNHLIETKEFEIIDKEHFHKSLKFYLEAFNNHVNWLINGMDN